MPLKSRFLKINEPGDFWALSLGEGEYAYMRVLRGGCVGVIPALSRGPVGNVAQLATYSPRWFFGFVVPRDDKTEMLRIGTMPFLNDEEAWSPPRYVPPDIFKGHYRIWTKGMQRQATEAEIKGLQKAQIASPAWLRRFALEHREECAFLKSDEQAEPFRSDEGKLKETKSRLLEIVFRNAEFPVAKRDLIEDLLSDALEKEGVGEVSGAGSGPETSAIDVEVIDVARGLEVIRKTLRKLRCPGSTVIHQYDPEPLIHNL